MTLRFEEMVLAKIEEFELRQVAMQLRALFFPQNQYNTSVSTSQFLEAISLSS